MPTGKVDDFSVDILLKRHTGLTNRLLVLNFCWLVSQRASLTKAINIKQNQLAQPQLWHTLLSIMQTYDNGFKDNKQIKYQDVTVFGLGVKGNFERGFTRGQGGK